MDGRGRGRWTPKEMSDISNNMQSHNSAITTLLCFEKLLLSIDLTANHLSIHPFIPISLDLFIFLLISPVYVFRYLPIRLWINLPSLPFIYLSLHLFTFLSFYLSIFIYSILVPLISEPFCLDNILLPLAGIFLELHLYVL